MVLHTRDLDGLPGLNSARVRSYTVKLNIGYKSTKYGGQKAYLWGSGFDFESYGLGIMIRNCQ